MCMMRELNEKKVEALREKWGAAIMMLNEEYIVARKKLLCVQKLYPELENITLMLTICDILLLASSFRLSYNKIDFNCILDFVYPSATYSDARHYLHNLVTSINGIKDEFPGSELALEIVQNALDMVSDREKKHFHDHGGVMDGMKGIISSNEILDAEETKSDFPLLLDQSSFEESLEEDEECQHQHQEFFNFEEERDADLFKPGQIWAINYQLEEVEFKHHRYAKINIISGDVLNITWLEPVPTSAAERVWCSAGLPISCGTFSMDPNACDQVRINVFSYKCSLVSSLMDDDQIGIYPKRGEIWAVYKDGVVNEWTCNRELLKGSKFELIEMFSDYSKCSGGDFVYLEKVSGFCSVFKRLISGKSPILFHISSNILLFSHKIPAHRLLGGKDEVLYELDQMALPKCLIQHDDSNSNKFLEHSISSTYDFASGQVWAIYSGKDTMPRRYAVVNNVVSDREVCVTLLEPEPVLDPENKCRNVPVACGMFKHGNGNVIMNMSQFSHLVKYVHGTRSYYMIYPKKGEVWAVYKNWNRKWEYSDYEKCKYWMVEILSDFSQEYGVKIAKLEEVHNCLTFFCRHQDEGFYLSCTVLETEMLCFSHQTIAYRVHGVERYGIPEYSWHLEPQAIPY